MPNLFAGSMRAIFQQAILCAASSVVLCIPLPALSWGTEGHQVIAKLAEGRLTPHARKEVDRLLSLEPGSTMASISTWADEHRNPSTAAWHYINFPRGNCTYDAERDCADAKCVVGAIERLAASLTDKVQSHHGGRNGKKI